MSHPHPQKLLIPPAAKEDSKARELLRVWAAKGKQHAILATGLWDDPGSWGITLVDLGKHLADAYHLTRGDDPAAVLARIRWGFDAEWNKATDTPTGRLLE